MKIAVASGKGGTGKTTISVSLALSSSGPTMLLDCDVEEPNAGLFLAQENVRETPVTVPVPVLDETACTKCGACAQFCEFNAIVHMGPIVMIFPELCHSCGGCALVCPVNAIHEEPSRIGTITESTVSRRDESGKDITPLTFMQGLLTIGNAMSPPVIRAVKDRAERSLADGDARDESFVVIDAPPGTSCPMCTTVTGVDYVILVTEPTPFGLHDLDLAVKTVRKMGLPFGVVINRCDSGDDRVVAYCAREGIRLLMQIPEDRRIAVGYSEGKPLVDSAPDYRKKFAALADLLSGEIRAKRNAG